ncbi:MarR family winged helix-turn-helix transcriptional regulator [Naasia lichenicola]|uniref:MarR family transcriptional regulator n=1 Tax=Naasia lichenicola TaxID=2565933 RepID=A0A4S4FLV4_9MICO|nr:MarR family transcriptional regulator [Naasia lichenicola]THG31074.1 MarR family transcriptional regulator [Naasia lichenicola]
MAQSPAVDAWESLFRAQVSMARYLNGTFPKEVSFNEYDVLFNLSRQPDRACRLRELTDRVLLTQPSISRLVDRLVGRGWLAKHPDELDGRGTIVQMTDAGLAVYRDIARVHARAIESRIGGALDTDELDELRALCERVRLSADT